MLMKEALIKALEHGGVKCQPLNGNLLEISKSSDNKKGFIKVAVSDFRAETLTRKWDAPVGIMLFIDGRVWSDITGK
ncbi:hypothetical protein [Paenibacillus sp. 23TSA30-6]|uniref:hypothetical protein n=1 Tax=Paenibacillus sp. 23TSA30-6 TaxID=2546104 RepID=UPI0017883A83|nr:hypothetical protein [Paenibacillus sp. 23TSA30-6]MBE0335097.1 hypothetical protein [Paenibacillus sp. 23TSA30-6]